MMPVEMCFGLPFLILFQAFYVSVVHDRKSFQSTSRILRFTSHSRLSAIVVTVWVVAPVFVYIGVHCNLLNIQNDMYTYNGGIRIISSFHFVMFSFMIF